MDDPTRTEALRAAGFAAVVDTQDPPGKVTVVFDLADFDQLIKALVKGDPATVVKARAEGVAEGRADGAVDGARNARRAVAVEMVAAAGEPGQLEAKVLELAHAEGVRIADPTPAPPGVHEAMTAGNPSAALKTGRTRG